MRDRGHRSSLRVIGLAAAVAAFALSASPAFAADITGTWDLPAGSVAKQSWTFTAGSGALAGSGAGGPYTWPMVGTITGNAVQISTTYNELPSYTAYFVGTVSPDGATMSGTWSTGGFAAAASSSSTWTATRRGAAPAPQPTTPKPAGVQVICNRGPDPDSLFTCTATVGGVSAPPTGTVQWSAGKGGFPLGDTCSLTATPLSPNVSSCTVTWNPGAGGFPAGVAPPVTATYQGDATTGAGSGAPQLYGIASLDPNLPPNLCAFNASCDGIDVLASGKAKLSARTGRLATLSAGCYGSAPGGKAAARAAQAGPPLTCGVSAEALLSAAGDAEVEALLARADKLLASASRKDQLKGQQLVQQANRRFGEIVSALQASGDLAKAGLDLSFDDAMAKADKLLSSPRKADQLAGQKLVQAAYKKLNADVQALQQRSEQTAKAIGSAVRRVRPATLATARVKVAGGRRGTLRLKAGAAQMRILSALRRAGIRSVTLRLQLSAVRSGGAPPASTRTTLKVALR